MKTHYERPEQSFPDRANANAINQYFGAESYKELRESPGIAS